jgi:hypothetical protein
VEPTQESISVAKEYLRLARHAGITNRIFFIGNKIEDDADRQFIEKHGLALTGSMPYLRSIKTIRQAGGVIGDMPIGSSLHWFTQLCITMLPAICISPQAKLAQLHRLHALFSSKPSTIKKYGDLSSQIDPAFVFPNTI